MYIYVVVDIKSIIHAEKMFQPNWPVFKLEAQAFFKFTELLVLNFFFELF